jgi:hypothetical protein
MRIHISKSFGWPKLPGRSYSFTISIPSIKRRIQFRRPLTLVSPSSYDPSVTPYPLIFSAGFSSLTAIGWRNLSRDISFYLSSHLPIDLTLALLTTYLDRSYPPSIEGSISMMLPNVEREMNGILEFGKAES